MAPRGSIQSSTHTTYSGRQCLTNLLSSPSSSSVTRQHHDHQSECLGHQTNLEFFASPLPSANLPLVPRLSVLAGDDQELQELCAKVRVLEARPVGYAKLMRDLEERHAELGFFFPKLQAKLTKLRDKLTDKEVARVMWERRAEAVGAELNGLIVCCEKQHERFKEALMVARHDARNGKLEASYEDTLIRLANADFEIE
ncbi:hypothetical protein BYT27DRAFT_7259061 [Phlegmacium glaucopus]|nr:hypothetical protein BYT27DRAFT_7259061 [Phlegmacium glaucopus]